MESVIHVYSVELLKDHNRMIYNAEVKLVKFKNKVYLTTKLIFIYIIILVIATPGRLIDFLQQEVTNLKRCSYLVLVSFNNIAYLL